MSLINPQTSWPQKSYILFIKRVHILLIDLLITQTLIKQPTDCVKMSSDLWICSSRNREHGGSGDMLHRVSQVLGGADGGEMGLDSGVGV